jgi:hypothetical protein
VKLYVCWGTFAVPWPRKGAPWRPAHHACKRAHDALKQAGYSPEVPLRQKRVVGGHVRSASGLQGGGLARLLGGLAQLG